jgi:hypothetical protein
VVIGEACQRPYILEACERHISRSETNIISMVGMLTKFMDEWLAAEEKDKLNFPWE